jgi:hypothetical protein
MVCWAVSPSASRSCARAGVLLHVACCPTRLGIAEAMSKAPDYGIYQIFLDDKPLTAAIDFYNAKNIHIGEISFPNIFLTKGKHTITFLEASGDNKRGPRFGIDYIRVGQ